MILICHALKRCSEIFVVITCCNYLTDPVCGDGEVRLESVDEAFDGLFKRNVEDGSGELETERGRVQFCVSGVWTYLCGNPWDFSSAAVACTQLGYQSVGQ